jgi:hypothetical protein
MFTFIKYAVFVGIIALCSLTYGQEVLKTPNDEVEDAIIFLQKIPEYDRDFIKFLSTYDIPEELREKAVLTASFIMHSLTGTSLQEEAVGFYYPLAKQDSKTQKFVPINRVTDTLWYIDLRHYNWTPAAWELVSQEDGIFVEPIINHRSNSLLRLLSGNAVLKMSWFLRQSTDVTLQVDRGSKTIIYDTLLYAKNKIPKNGKEFEETWGLKIEEARKRGNEYGTLVTKSKAVARHNRILFAYRTDYGFLHTTYDVKFEEGNRDYVETFPKLGGLPPTTFDAKERFATNQNLMQVYALTDQNDNIVPAGDTAAVRHLNDILGDVRVRSAHSCLDCHSAGPLPSENSIKEFIKRKSDLYVKDFKTKARIDRVYLNERFEESIKDTQDLFARGLLKINGLTPEENGKNYLEIIEWYETPVDMKQAAVECGMSEKDFKFKLALGKELGQPGQLAGRLSLLLDGESIPRTNWDSKGKEGIPGQFQQAMTTIYGLTKIIETESVLIIQKDCNLLSGTKTIATLRAGQQVNFLEKLDQGGSVWYKVSIGSHVGWVSSQDAKFTEKEIITGK